jgi:hypothetical protein
MPGTYQNDIKTTIYKGENATLPVVNVVQHDGIKVIKTINRN